MVLGILCGAEEHAQAARGGGIIPRGMVHRMHCIPTMPCTYGDVRAPRFTQVAHGAASVTAMGTHQMYA